MPNHSRSHTELRSCICGVCGIKKQKVIPITIHILNQIREKHNSAYDITDERYPTAICTTCQGTLCDLYREPPIQRRRLPDVPPFTEVPKACPITRCNPTGYDDDTHSLECFVCAQNKAGRPRKRARSASTDQTCAELGHAKCPCPTCFQPHTGRGISHKCDMKQTENLGTVVKQFPQRTQEQVVHAFIKDKITESGDNVATLHTKGRDATVVLNHRETSKVKITSKTLDDIKRSGNFTQNQMEIVTGGIRSTAGRSSIEPHYRQHMSEQNKLLEQFYETKQVKLVTESKDGVPTKYTDTWVVYAEIVPLINAVNELRGIVDATKYLVKVMGDTGGGFFKVCVCVIPLEKTEVKTSRATYADGGALAKGKLLSGVNRCIMVICCAEIKEHYNNLVVLFDMVKFNDIFTKFPNVEFIGDLKMIAEMYGLMSAASRFNCPYCESEKGSLKQGTPRTLKNIRMNYENWQHSGGKKEQCKKFFNVQHLPIFDNLPPTTSVISITPPPELHILLGIVNHLWKHVENMSPTHAQALHDFAKSHDCVREEMFGKVFEGNECRKILNCLNHPTAPFPRDLDDVKEPIKALEMFKCLKNSAFGEERMDSWEDDLNNFMQAYNDIPGISVPLKVHIVAAHIEEFFSTERHGFGLGFYSEQAGESIHQKFSVFHEKYKMKNVHSQQYGNRLFRSVLDFSSTHV